MNTTNTSNPPKSGRKDSATKAYSYIRFSTPEQQHGDSLRRQTAMAEAYAGSHGLELDDKLTFEDLGVSAFSGANVATGQLGAFLEAVEQGIVPRGSFLLVENLDRISRQTARKAARTLELIVETGITLVTLNDGKQYTVESIEADPFAFTMITLQFAVSNFESVKKQGRLREAWTEKRKEAALTGKAMTAQAPAWLSRNGDGWSVIKERAEIVRRIFEETRKGVGLGAIARRLNKENVPTFTDRAEHWRESYVNRIRTNPAVIGTHTPKATSREGKKRRYTSLEPIESYYPTIIDLDLWNDVQAILTTNAPVRGKPRELANVLGGISKCAKCGSSMVRVNKRGRFKLVCVRAKSGAGCAYRTVDLTAVERALVTGMARAVAEAPDPNGKHVKALMKIEAEIAGVEDAIERLMVTIERTDARGGAQDALLRRLEGHQTTLQELQAGRDQEQRMVALADPRGHRRRMDGLIDAFQVAAREDGKGLREDGVPAANAALRQAVNMVVIDYDAGTLDVCWLTGGISRIMYTL